MLATVTSKGQITLPKKVRDKLSIDTGTKLSFKFVSNNAVEIRPLSSNPLDLAKVLPQRKHPRLSLRQIDTILAQSVAAHVLGRKRR